MSEENFAVLDEQRNYMAAHLPLGEALLQAAVAAIASKVGMLVIRESDLYVIAAFPIGHTIGSAVATAVARGNEASMGARAIALLRRYAEHHEAHKAEPGTIDAEVAAFIRERGL